MLPTRLVLRVLWLAAVVAVVELKELPISVAQTLQYLSRVLRMLHRIFLFLKQRTQEMERVVYLFKICDRVGLGSGFPQVGI